MDLGDSGDNAVIDNRQKQRTLESGIRIAEASRGEQH